MKKYIGYILVLVIGILIGVSYSAYQYRFHSVLVSNLLIDHEAAIKQNIFLLKYLDENNIQEAKKYTEINIQYRLEASPAYLQHSDNETHKKSLSRIVSWAECSLNDRSLSFDEVQERMNLTNCSKGTAQSAAP